MGEKTFLQGTLNPLFGGIDPRHSLSVGYRMTLLQLYKRMHWGFFSLKIEG